MKIMTPVRLTLIAFNPQIQKNVRLTLFCAFNRNLSGKKIRVKRRVLGFQNLRT